jgi:ParB family chromosome partitioning protein
MSTSTRTRARKAAPPPPPPRDLTLDVAPFAPQTPVLGLGALQSVPLDLIDPDPKNARQIPASPAEEAALRASIAQQGVIEPPTIRVHPDDPARFMVMFGHRRVAAAKALDLGTIRCILHIGEDFTDAQVEAVQTAENVVRAAMHPVDVWKAAAHLVGTGMAEHEAFAALGVSKRQGALLRRLGQIDGEILDAIATVPPSQMDDLDRYLHTISTSPVEDQRKAWKKLAKGNGSASGKIADLARALARPTVSFAEAIFPMETSKLAWIEDLFAEPDNPERFTTTDFKGFVKEQEIALSAAVKAEADAGYPIRMVAWDDKRTQPLIPAGYVESYMSADKPAPKGGTDLIVAAVAPDGLRAGRVVRERVHKIAAKPAKAKGAKGNVAPEPKPPLTQKGMNLVADEKQQAIRTALDQIHTPEQMLAALLVAIGGGNVTVQGQPVGVDLPFNGYHGNRLTDLSLAVATMGPNAFGLDYHNTVMDAARKAIARIVIAPAPKRFQSSGPAADWLGHIIGAEAWRPRLDTTAILETASGDTLRHACKLAGKASGKRADMVKALAGALPGWLPVDPLFPAPALAEVEAMSAAHAGRRLPRVGEPEPEGDPEGEAEGNGVFGGEQDGEDGE